MIKDGAFDIEQDAKGAGGSALDQPLYEYRKVHHMWRSQIQFNKTQPVKIENEYQWRNFQDPILANYFKLYTRFLQFQKFTIVAHRSYLSVFDSTKRHGKGNWLSQHLQIGNGSDKIRELILYKLPINHS